MTVRFARKVVGMNIVHIIRKKMKNKQQWKAMKYLAKNFPNKYRLKKNDNFSSRGSYRSFDLEEKSWFLGTIWFTISEIRI